MFVNYIKHKSRSYIEIETKLNHFGPVLNAKPIPQIQSTQNKIFATKTISGDINIFKYSKANKKNLLIKPYLVLKGHDKEGYAIDFN